MIDGVITGDDFLDKLTRGAYRKNPNYNPKTKAGKTQPPFIVDTTPGNLDKGSLTESVDRISKLRFAGTDLGMTNEDIKNRADDGFTISAYDSESDINSVYARQQSSLAKVGNALIRTGLGEVAMGTLAGFGNIADGLINWYTGDNYYQNPWTEFWEKQKNDLDEYFKIYRENPNKSFDVADVGWWTENAISIASTASLLLPAVGWARGAGYVGKLSGLSKVANLGSKYLSKAIAKGITRTIHASEEANNTMKILRTAGKIDKSINTAGRVASEAFFSRTGENQMEGKQNYDETYLSNMDMLNNMSDDEYKRFIERHVEFKDKSKEDIANTIASRAARETFKNDYWMLLMDIPQFYTLGRIWEKTLEKGTTSAAERIAIKNAKLKLAGVADDKLIKNNFINRIKEHTTYGLTHPTSTLVVNELGEGFEEGFQGVQSEKGKEVAERYFNPNYISKGLDSYLTDPSIWEQAFWGWVGGIAFQPIATGVHKGVHKAQGYYKYKKGELTAEQYEQWGMSQDKITMKKLENITNLTDEYLEQKKLIDEGKNPFRTIKDENGNDMLIDGQAQFDDIIDEEDKLQAINQTIQGIVDNTIYESLDNGTFDIFKEVFSSKEFAKYLKDKGVNTTKTDDALRKEIVDRMNTIEGIYSKAANDVYSIADDTNPFIVNAMARQITRDTLDNAEYENIINAISTEIINNNGNINEFSQFNDQSLISAVEKEYNDIQKQIDNISKNTSYSQSAKEYQIKQLKKKQEKLKDYVNKNTINGISIGTNDDNTIIISTNNAEETLGKQEIPPSNVRELIDRKHKIGVQKALHEAGMLVSAEDYTDRYDEFARSMSNFTMKKIDKYIKDIEDYLRKSDNIDTAVTELMNGKIEDKNLKEAADYLRYGLISNNFDSLIGQAAINKKLSDVINKVKKERKDTEAKVREAENNGTPLPVTENNTEDNNEDNIETNDEEDESDNTEDIEDTEEDKGKNNETEKGTEVPPPIVPSTGSGTESNEGIPMNPNQEEGTNEDIEPTLAPDEINTEEGAIAPDTPIIDNPSDEEQLSDKQLDDLEAINKGLNTENLKASMAASRFVAIRGIKQEAFFNEMAEALDKEDKFKYDAFIKEIIKYCTKQGIDEKTAETAAKEAFSTIVNSFAAMNKQSGFAKLANKLAFIEKYNSDTNFISNEKIEEVFDGVIDEYIKECKNNAYSDGRYVINIQNLFNYVLDNPNISKRAAKYLYENISKYISINNGKKYIFTGFAYNGKLLNTEEFFNVLNTLKAERRQNDAFVHISPLEYTQRPKNYTQLLIDAYNGAPTYIKTEAAFDGSKNLAIYVKTKKGDFKIGILRSVDLNKDGNGFHARSHYSGFSNSIIKNSDDSFSLDSDFFFNALINETTTNPAANELFNIFLEYCIKRDEITKSNMSDAERKKAYAKLTTDEIAKKILNNELIKELLDKGIYKFYKDLGSTQQLTDIDKARKLVNSITNILFYHNKFSEISPTNNVTNDFFTDTKTMAESYNNWKRAIYNNYKLTYEYEKALNGENSTIDISINVDHYFKANTIKNPAEYVNIGDNNFEVDSNSKNHTPLIIVNKEGHMIDENGKDLGEADISIQPYSIGFIIHNENGNKFVAYCNTAQDISKSEIANDVKEELKRLIDRQIYNVNESTHLEEFNSIFDSLNELIGVSGIFKCKDVRIITTPSKSVITITKGGEKILSFYLYNYNKTTNQTENSNAVSIIGKGENGKNINITDFNNTDKNKLRNEVIDNILEGLTINRSEEAISGKLKTGANSHYVTRENGKYNLHINNKIISYENYGDFIIKNRAFNTNIDGRNNGFGHYETNTERISINTTIRNTDNDVAPNNTNVTDLCNETITSNKKTIHSDKLLEAAGVKQQQIDLLIGKNTGVPIVTTSVTYDNESDPNDVSSPNAYYSPKDKRIHITARGATSMNNNPTNAIRLLVHENIHRLFHNNTNYTNKQRERIVGELKEVYDYVLEQLEKDKNAGNISENLYDAIINVFNTATNGKDEAAAMEEFLTECLTQPALIEYLNNTQYKELVDIDGIPNNKKSILQKIMDILLELFGLNGERIKNNSILAREYAILSKTNNATSSGLFANANQENTGKNKKDNDSLPVEGNRNTNVQQEITEKLKAVRARIDNFRRGFESRIKRSDNFAQDHTYYVDGKKSDDSVTGIIHGHQDIGAWGVPSSALGNTADEAARIYFRYNGAIPDNVKISNVTEKQRKELIKDLDRLKEYLNNRFGIGKYGVITDEFPIGGIVHTNKGDLTIAGTMDMLVYDADGNLYIFDFKTKRNGNVNESTKLGYDQQVNIYRQFIEANYPEFKGKVKIGGLIKFTTEYDAPVNHTLEDGTKVPNYRMSPTINGQLQYRDAYDEDYKDIQNSSNEEYIPPYFVANETIEEQILNVEQKDYKDKIDALPKLDNNTNNEQQIIDIEESTEIDDILRETDDLLRDIDLSEDNDIDIDNLDAKTELIENTSKETPSEIYTTPIVQGNADNVYGVRLVNDMNEFIQSFPEQYRAGIEHLMARNELNYSCM